jgi:putative hydrolase of the HAD superfamily
VSLPIKHISLDVWQTLIHSNLEFRKKRNELLADHFNIKKPFGFVETAAKTRQAWCTQVNELVGKNLDSFEIVLLILQDCAIDSKSISIDLYAKFYTQMETLFLEHPPVLAEQQLFLWLTQVRQHNISVSLLSNTGLIKGETLNKFFQRLNLNFDFALYSDEIGFSKPNPKAFDLVYQKSRAIKNLLPKEIVHVGDNLNADYAGALAVGFQAQLIDHSENTVSSYLSKHVFNIRQT